MSVDWLVIVLLCLILAGAKFVAPQWLQVVDFQLLLLLLASLLLAGVGGEVGERFGRVVRGRERKLLMLALWTAAAYLSWWAGVTVESVKLPFTTRFVNLGIGGLPITLVWLVALTATFTNTTAVPGLPFGVAALSGATFFTIALLRPQTLSHIALTLSAAITLVGIIGLHPYFRSQQRRFSSAGGAALGFGLALCTVAGALKNTAFLVLILPLVVLGVPMLETTYTVFRRAHKLSGSVTLETRRESLYDFLKQAGLTEEKLRALLMLANAYLCILALVLVLLIRIHFTVKLALLLFGLGFGALCFGALVRFWSRKPVDLGARALVFGVPISNLSMEEVLQRIEEFIITRQPHIVVTSDTSAVVLAQKDSEFQEIVRRADLVTPDGIGVVLGARLLGLPIYERVPGCDLMGRVCELAAQKGYKVFLLGAKPQTGNEPSVAEQAASRLQDRWQNLNIVGTHHGYFSSEEEPQVIQRIRKAEPDVLFVAFGIPKQEKWIARHIRELNVPVCIGVGGSFDVYAGKVKRAPLWLQRLGLEWLYRTLSQPRRIARLLTIPKFLLWILRQSWKDWVRCR